MSNLALLLVISFVFHRGISQNVDELLGVAVIYRHGDRVPIETYPNDPYADSSFWPVGLGQLTNIGKRQHYELGQWFRTRYQDFLSAKYSEKDIYVQSTDVDRTLMSAASNLAGLYQPVEEQIWNDNILWQPIPIHTTPEVEDAVLAMKKPCPKYELLLSELWQTDYFQQLEEDNKQLYEYLSFSTGKNISTLLDVEYLYGVLLVDEIYNYTLPSWTESVYPEILSRVAGISFGTWSYTPDLARLKSGPLLDEIVNHFERIRVNDTSAQKFLMFSAHDTTIANVLSSFGAFDFTMPPYASTLILELRRNDLKDYVKVLYKREAELEQIMVKTCDLDCEIGDFEDALDYVIVSLKNWEKECNEVTDQQK